VRYYRLLYPDLSFSFGLSPANAAPAGISYAIFHMSNLYHPIPFVESLAVEEFRGVRTRRYRDSLGFEDFFVDTPISERPLKIVHPPEDGYARSFVIRNGVNVTVEHPFGDLGDPSSMFDGNSETVFRTIRTTPMVFHLSLPPLSLRKIWVTVSSPAAKVGVSTRSEGRPSDWRTRQASQGKGESHPTARFRKTSPTKLDEIHITIDGLNGSRGVVQINEIGWE
jgi:hypothetical protein